MTSAELILTDSDEVEHRITAVRVVKMEGPLKAWRFSCSCGRYGNGWHNAPEKAIERGGDHVR